MSYDVGVECTGSDAILPGVEYWCCHLVVFFFPPVWISHLKNRKCNNTIS